VGILTTSEKIAIQPQTGRQYTRAAAALYRTTRISESLDAMVVSRMKIGEGKITGC